MATTATPRRVKQASSSLSERYRRVRVHSERLCQPLRTEDHVVSTMPDVKPTTWHLAHTTWFFEHFVLAPHLGDYTTPDARYGELFGEIGRNGTAPRYGILTRPTVKRVLAYRHHVDDHVLRLIERIGPDAEHPAVPVITLGLQHEQQHQELILADIKHVFWANAMRPSYHPPKASGITITGTRRASSISNLPPWCEIACAEYEIGHSGGGFSFDSEKPAHRVSVERFRIGSHLVTNDEYLRFIEDGGYRRPELWLPEGWNLAQQQTPNAPLYWEPTPSGWAEFTLGGDQALELSAPVNHVTYYEADAYARWAGARLPTEVEWEVAAREIPVLPQLLGRRWQWTQSAAAAYPGHVQTPGVIGDYSRCAGDQCVLRGSSSLTPPGHARITYRKFLRPDARWQFTGIRLAASA